MIVKLRRAWALAVLALASTAAPAAVFYEMTNLGPLPGSTGALNTPMAINSSGQVAGYGNSHVGYYHAFRYDSGTMTDLGTLAGGTISQGYGINDAGLVVGRSNFDQTNAYHAFLYGNGVMIDLGTLGGRNSSAVDINASGQIVGSSSTAGNDTRAFLFSNGVMSDLGSLGGISYAAALNSIGQVVGSYGTYTRNAFLFDNGAMTDLGTLGGFSAQAEDINDVGQIVGTSATADNQERAFLYENGVMRNLGTVDNDHESSAVGVNNAGQVVGISNGALGQRAFLYADGEMFDLNDLIDPNSTWILTQGLGINDTGQIIAAGYGDLTSAAFLLTPRELGPVGETPDNPVMPGPDNPSTPGFDIPVEVVNPDQALFVDPIWAVGYDYSVDPDGPLFTSVLVPGALPGGDSLFELLLGGGAYALSAGVPLDFTQYFANGVASFGIRGLDVSEMIDPSDPTAFVTGLTFSKAGSATIVMNPITVEVNSAVPEPATWAMMIVGFGAVGYSLRRRPRRRLSRV